MATTLRRPLVAGNWKMNGLRADLAEIAAVAAGIEGAGCDVAICPPATLLYAAGQIARDSTLLVGAQDCHTAISGANTGDISAEMIADAGGRLVIVGHSERRADHGETNEILGKKAEAAWRAGLLAVLCVGETEAERRSGATLAVLTRQVLDSVPENATAANLVIAYEPVWAIGTGLTPSEDDIAEAHAHIRRRLAEKVGPQASATRILYGGSVKPSNAVPILSLADVDGALVGGASLKAADFLGIIAAAR